MGGPFMRGGATELAVDPLRRDAMKVSLSLDEFKKVSYLRLGNLAGRIVPLQPYFDGQDWHLWVPHSEQELVRLRTPEFIRGSYYAAAQARPSDVYVRILDFLTRRVSFPSVVPIAHAIEHDVLNLAAVIWKTDLLFDVGADRELSTDTVIGTDVEYALVVCRSMLDLLQSVLSALWRNVQITVEGQGASRVRLPRSIAGVLAHGEVARTEQEIRTKFRIPECLSEFYYRSSSFALRLREARDALVHLPSTTPFVFRMERGFGVRVEDGPFRDLAAWDTRQLEVNGIGSLRFFLASVVLGTLRVCEDLAETLEANVELPEDLAPGLHVFERSDHVKVLHRLDDVMKSPWSRFVGAKSA
jgi:hypothetical protein